MKQDLMTRLIAELITLSQEIIRDQDLYGRKDISFQFTTQQESLKNMIPTTRYYISNIGWQTAHFPAEQDFWGKFK